MRSFTQTSAAGCKCAARSRRPPGRRWPSGSNTPEILRKESYRVVPWRNGGGVTCEIAASAPSDWDWRLSVATIERDGPFSDFAGYDRTIVPIEGNGIELEFDGERTVTLDRLFEPLAFRGESKVSCRLIDGPVRDFNVMTRRGRYTHRATIVTLDEDGPAVGGSGPRFAYVLRGELGGARAGDTLQIDAEDSAALSDAAAGTTLCIVHLYPKAGPSGH